MCVCVRVCVCACVRACACMCGGWGVGKPISKMSNFYFIIDFPQLRFLNRRVKFSVNSTRNKSSLSFHST